MKTAGHKSAALLECINPKKGCWRVRWNKQQDPENENLASWEETQFDHKPDVEEIKATVLAWYNAEIDQKILSGFEFEGAMVWLSAENRFNYKAAFDLAVMTGGAILPVTFKLGTDENPVYRTFSELEDLQAFYTQAMTHINTVLAEGWQTKDNINWEEYAL